MLESYRSYAIALLISLFSGALTAQSPWTQSKAGFYTQAAIQNIPGYSRIFNHNDFIDLKGKIHETTFQFYEEYGFSRKWTGILAVPAKFTSRTRIQPTDPEPASLSGLGNTQIGMKYGFDGGGLKMATTFMLHLPATGGEKIGLRTGFDAFTIQPSFSIGKGLGKYYWYAYTGAGLRTNNYSSYIQTGGECGVHFGRFWEIVFTEWMQSLENGTRTALPANLETGLFMDQQSWWSFGLKTIIKTGRFTGVVLSAGGAFTGKNVANRPALSAAYYFKWE